MFSDVWLLRESVNTSDYHSSPNFFSISSFKALITYSNMAPMSRCRLPYRPGPFKSWCIALRDGGQLRNAVDRVFLGMFGVDPRSWLRRCARCLRAIATRFQCVWRVSFAVKMWFRSVASSRYSRNARRASLQFLTLHQENYLRGTWEWAFGV